VIINSKVTSGIQPDAPRDTISLGRPWRPFSRVVYINTELPASVISQGWNLWGRAGETPQAYYAEYESTGPGANSAARVAWSHQLTAQQAAQYAPRVFLAGKDHWDPIAEAQKLP
jgi:pectinesterase